MSAEEMARLVRDAWLKASDQVGRDWDRLDPWEQAAYGAVGQAVRDAVIADEFGPRASVVATVYLRALERLARAARDVAPLADAGPSLDEFHAALVEATVYPDWQRGGS